MSNSRRPHFSPDQRFAILDDYRASRLTQREFAAQAGISVATLQNWLKAAASSASPEFVELPPPTRVHSQSGAYKVQFPNGISLELPVCFQARDAQELIGWLKAL